MLYGCVGVEARPAGIVIRVVMITTGTRAWLVVGYDHYTISYIGLQASQPQLRLIQGHRRVAIRYTPAHSQRAPQSVCGATGDGSGVIR